MPRATGINKFKAVGLNEVKLSATERSKMLNTLPKGLTVSDCDMNDSCGIKVGNSNIDRESLTDSQLLSIKTVMDMCK